MVSATIPFPLPHLDHRALWRLTESIVESDAVLRTFSACEWECLNDDGKVWIMAIVRETLRRAALGQIDA